jgi:acid phosphatase
MLHKVSVAAVFSVAVSAQTTVQPARTSLEKLNAVLWMQTSVEYSVIVRQTFTVARIALDRALKDKRWTAAPE